MKWMSIVPLVGGMSIGAKNVLGNPPEAILSYPAFQGNDQYLLNYWDYKNYHLLDPVENKIPESINVNEVGVVNAVCPCAGLSTLNSSSSMGSDAPQNEWMYKTADLVLEQIRPEVFLGENAPGLFTNLGEGVVNKLRDIGKKHGYTFSLYKTDNSFHGIPQKRIRTFYFFWKGDKTPILPWINKERSNIEDYLKEIPADATYQDKVEKAEALQSNFLWRFLTENISSDTKKLREIIFNSAPNRNVISVYKFLFNKENPMELIYKNKEMIDKWCNSLLESGTDEERKDAQYIINKTSHIVKKIEAGGNFWDSSIRFIKGNVVNAVTSKNKFMDIHPTEDRFLTFREQMHLMKLPHDFVLNGTKEIDIKNKNVISQNVIVDSSIDVHKWAKLFIEKKLELVHTDFIKQNNISQTVEKEEQFINKKLF